MKKTIPILLMILVTAVIGYAQIHIQTSDRITISGAALDSAGFYQTPDSVRIIVYFNGSEEHDAWYNSGDAQCSELNDMLVFTDEFADIDNDAGNGLYEIQAGFHYDDDSTFLWKSFSVYVGGGLDSIYAILDTLQLWDTRVDSIEAALADANIGDKVWTDGSHSNRDEINDILDTLQLWDTRVDSIEAALADGSIGDKVWTDGSHSNRDEINDILDTLQNHDDWVATATNQAEIPDIADTLELYDTRFDSLLAALSDGSIGDKVWTDGSFATRGEINDILDTLQNHDDWVAKNADVENIDGWDPILDGDSLIIDMSSLDVTASVPDSLFDTLTAIHSDVTGITASVPDSLWDTLTAIHGDVGGGTATVFKYDCLRPDFVYNSDLTTLHFYSPTTTPVDSVITICYPYARGSYDDAAIVGDTLYPVSNDTISSWWAASHDNIIDSTQAFGAASFDSLFNYDCYNIVFYKGTSPDTADLILFDQIFCTLDEDSIAALMTANLFPLSETADSISNRMGAALGVQLHYVRVVDSANWGGGSFTGIPSVEITYANSAGKYFGMGRTNSDGVFAIGGLVGEYLVTVANYNYEFMDTSYNQSTAFYDTISTGEYNDTLYILSVERNPAAPFVRITGSLEDFGDAVKYASIYYSLSATGTVYDTSGAGETFISPKENYTLADSSGQFAFNVYSTSVLFDEKGNHPKYNIMITSNDGTVILPWRKITVPASYIGTSVKLTDLL